MLPNRDPLDEPTLRQAVHAEKGFAPVADDQVLPVRRQPGPVRSLPRAEFPERQPGLGVEDDDPVAQQIERIQHAVVRVESEIPNQRGGAASTAPGDGEFAAELERPVPKREFPDAAAGAAADEDLVAAAVERQPQPSVGGARCVAELPLRRCRSQSARVSRTQPAGRADGGRPATTPPPSAGCSGRAAFRPA